VCGAFTSQQDHQQFLIVRLAVDLTQPLSICVPFESVLFQLFASFGTEALVSFASSPYLSETDYYLNGPTGHHCHYHNYNCDNIAGLNFLKIHVFSLKLQTHVAFWSCVNFHKENVK
jgi:hypothetical protein